MRGLPYDTTTQQVVDFFASHHFKQEPNDNNTEIINKNKESTESKSITENNGTIVEQVQKQNKSNSIEEKMETTEQKSDLNNNEEKIEKKTTKVDKAPYCRVMDNGVLFCKRKDGRASGDAFCLFENEKEGQLALTKHRQLIGTRYIELFRSSNSEVQQVFNKTNEQNQLMTNKSNILNQTSFTSYLPVHHQSTNAIYQPANTNLPLINNQQTQTIMNGQQSTMQNVAAANNAVLQPPSLGSHHLHHPSSVTSLNYSGHSSFHHQQPPVGNTASIHYHQLATHAQHNQTIKQQQQHNLTSHANPSAGGNYHQTNANNKYVHLQSQTQQQQQQQKQHLHLLNSSPTTCTINKPHSVCTSSPIVNNTSPINSLNTSSCNGLISCSKVTSSTNNNGNLVNRPLFCIQPTATATQTSAATTTTNAGQYKVVVKDCIRLRNLPFEANVDQILDFLGEHSHQIVYQGVHLIYTLNGAFSGEAFLQMRSEYAANQAVLSRHHKCMQFGKKQRYIEVIQCCLDDMLLVSDNGQFINNSNNLVNGGLAAMQQHRTLSE